MHEGKKHFHSSSANVKLRFQERDISTFLHIDLVHEGKRSFECNKFDKMFQHRMNFFSS